MLTRFRRKTRATRLRVLLHLRQFVLIPALCLPVLIVGCAASAPSSRPATLVLVDSVILKESDSIFVGRPGGLRIDSVGRMYVPDLLADRLLRFDRHGRFERSYGRSGSGPGEFRGVGEAVVIWDTILINQSYGHRRLSGFHLDTGRPLFDLSYLGTLTSGSRFGLVAWFGNLDQAAARGVLRLDLRSLSSIDHSSEPPLRSSLAPFPPAYLTNELIRGTYGLVYVVPWTDTVMVGYAASNSLATYLFNGRQADTLLVPVSKRRGVPSDFVERADLGRSSMKEIFALGSALFGIWRKANGEFLTIHMDSDLDGKRSIRSTAFASVISADRTRACVDAVIPTSGEGQPKIDVRGDTLYVLDQYSVPQQTRVLSVVRLFTVSETGCSWLSTMKGSL